MAAYPKKAKVPVSRHPAFPLVVALWFAALLSLGSLAIRQTALERMVLASHIDLVVPAAAPPLGFTARICLAAGLFVIGALAGFLLGRGIARAGRPAAPSHRFAEVRQPAPVETVDEDEDLQRLDSARSAPMAGNRRRSLAMREEYVQPYIDHVPTHGGAPEILDLSVLEEIAERVAGPEPLVVTAEADPEPEDEGEDWYDDFEEVVDEAPAAETLTAEAPPAEAPAHAPRAFDAPAANSRPFAPPAEPVMARLGPATIEEPAGLGLIPRDAAEKLRTAPIGTLGVVELAERLAMAISRRRGAPVTQVAQAEAPAQISEPVLETQPEPQPAPEPEPEAIVTTTPAEVAEPVAAEPPAQVFDRLLGAAAKPALAPEPEAPAAIEPAPAPRPIPAAMRPIRFEDFIDEDDAEEALLPPRRFAMPAQATPVVPANDLPASAVAAAEPAEDNYGSLLEMKTPQRPAFVRIEDEPDETAEIEPVVIFPGHGAAAESPATQPPRRFDAPSTPVSPPRVASGQAHPVDPEETERALKAALATLQRMSGAA